MVLKNETDRRRSGLRLPWLRWVAPIALAVCLLVIWQIVVHVYEVPRYKLPSPWQVGASMVENRTVLLSAWLVTLRTMGLALLAAVIGGTLLAVVFVSSKILELSLFPYAIILQVTPLVAIAPLLLIWIDSTWLVLLLCAWIVAFFPILSNTTIGLRSIDPGLRDLFDLYGASPWQRLKYLLIPSALPFFIAGLRIAVNLSLVGAVVAEFVTGASGVQSGLASVLYDGQYRLDTPLMFASLFLISLTGVVCFFMTFLLSYLCLSGWHETES